MIYTRLVVLYFVQEPEPVPGGMNEQQARDFCQRYLTQDHEWARECSKVPDVDATTDIENCMMDIAVSITHARAQAHSHTHTHMPAG